MVYILCREQLNSKQCTYGIKRNPQWKAVGRRILGTGKCKIDLYNDGKLIYTLKQTSIIGQIIEKTPIIGWWYWNKFYLYQDGVCCGSSKSDLKFGQLSLWFEFGADRYHLLTHSLAKQSLTKNGKQVAVYQRFDNTDYGCHCLKDSVGPDILLMFAVLIETYGMLDKGWRSGYIPNDPYKERASWRPPDE
jgi:hypothetical protein